MRSKHMFVALGACALLAGFGVNAQAKTVMVTDVEMPNALTGTLSGPSPVYNGEVYVGPTVLTLSDGSHLTVYCNDPWNEINLGANQSLPFSVGPLTTSDSFNGQSLTSTEIGKITSLATAGLASTDNVVRAEYGAAIWDLEIGGQDAFTFSDPTYTSFAQILANSATPSLTPGTEYLSQSGVQSFVGPSAVPEPGVWAMLILGFGAVGAAMRFNRRGAGSLTVA
jgi:hypothetical protein